MKFAYAGARRQDELALNKLPWRGSLREGRNEMRRRIAGLLALLGCLLLPAWAEAEGYLIRVRGDKDEHAEKVERLGAFRSSGLSSLRELRNLPGYFVASMPPSAASLMAEEGYDVELLPERHALGDPPWSLDRENQRTLPLDGDITHPYTGRGTKIFILDTGLYQSPEEFGERFLGGTNYVPDGKDIFATCGEAFTHATAVASAAAGNSFGVAPGATIFLMRVIGCDNFVGGPESSLLSTTSSRGGRKTRRVQSSST